LCRKEEKNREGITQQGKGEEQENKERKESAKETEGNLSVCLDF
jgi:hypothetical protein